MVCGCATIEGYTNQDRHRRATPKSWGCGRRWLHRLVRPVFAIMAGLSAIPSITCFVVLYLTDSLGNYLDCSDETCLKTRLTSTPFHCAPMKTKVILLL